VTGACATDEVGQPIDFCRALGPKRNTTVIRLVLRRFGDPKKVRRSRPYIRFKLQPALDRDATDKAEGGQKRFVKRPRLGEIMYAKIDVIVSSCHDCPENRAVACRESFALLGSSPVAIHPPAAYARCAAPFTRGIMPACFE
jgi:hypothetical protein